MPRRRGKDARKGEATRPATPASDIAERKREREPRSDAERQRQRDPDAIDRNPDKAR